MFRKHRQHGETVQRYDQTRTELEYYRGQNQVVINEIEQVAQESSSFGDKQAATKQILNRSIQVHISYCFFNIRRSNKIDFTEDYI